MLKGSGYRFGHRVTLERKNSCEIKNVEPHLGYIHRSIEKMCESLTYRQFIYVTSRMDYLSSHINNHACALCVEKGMQIEIPPRAQVIRVLMDELTRIASHELWWGAMAMDLGAFTPFFHAFRERESINDIMEIFKSFHQVGATLLISTHDESILRQFQGRKLSLKQGELQA